MLAARPRGAERGGSVKLRQFRFDDPEQRKYSVTSRTADLRLSPLAGSVCSRVFALI